MKKGEERKRGEEQKEMNKKMKGKVMEEKKRWNKKRMGKKKWSFFGMIFCEKIEERKGFLKGISKRVLKFKMIIYIQFFEKKKNRKKETVRNRKKGRCTLNLLEKPNIFVNTSKQESKKGDTEFFKRRVKKNTIKDSF